MTELTDEEVIGRLTELLGPQGFARLEALAEKLHKNPPTIDQHRQMMETTRERNRQLGVTDDDIARIKTELFG